MVYNLIKVPEDIIQNNTLMCKEDAKKYFHWFMSIKNERLIVLQEEFNGGRTLKFDTNELNDIQRFIKMKIALRIKTKEEIYIEKEILPPAIKEFHKILNYEIIEPTMSVIFDVSIYLGELLKKEVKGVTWTYMEDEEIAYFGYPVLFKKDISQNFCPLWILETLIYQIHDETVAKNKLCEMFNTWKNTFLGKQIDYRAMVDSWTKKK